jgi:signal transduction histidine kinase
MALALLDDDDPDRHGVAEQAARDIAELDALIGDLLLASRLDAERPLDLEPVELLGLAAEEAARVGAAVDGDARIVQGDPRLLRRLLRNLLENARRYSADVEVVVGPSTIEVRDRGPGVPEADRERIFEPFYRPPGHREGDGGVGLGLSLVLSITIRHGGRVWVAPREGGGSVFTLELV